MASLFWVNKTAESKSLSHSDNRERIQVFSQAQRTSRPGKRKGGGKDGTVNGRKSAQKNGTDNSRRLLSSVPYATVVAGDEIDSNHPTLGTQQSWCLTLDPVPLLDPDRTIMEARSLEFFNHVSLRKIITTEQNFSFWNVVVPRLASCHAAFRHLVAAIASTHELLYSDDAETLNAFALTQCNKAITLLRSSQDWPPALVLISCILVSAYSLLRCDLDQAEASIESGLKIATKCTESNLAGLCDERATYQHILAQLGRQHGFKLWAPDVNFQFERSKAREKCITIETECVKGPFEEPKHAMEAVRLLLQNVVTRIMRNLARGACIEPSCSLTDEVDRQFAMFSFHWESLHRLLCVYDEDGVLELKQIKIGFRLAILMFHTKIVGPSERLFEAYPAVVEDMLQLAEEVVTAGEEGRPVVYLDKLVNAAICSLGFALCAAKYKKRAMNILQRQANDRDGLTNWLRGSVIETMMMLDQMSLSWWSDPFAPSRLILSGLRGTNDGNCIWIQFKALCSDAAAQNAIVPINWTSWSGPRPAAAEVDSRLQGILAAYRMYGKPHSTDAPDGFVAEMIHRGRRVPVAWEPV